MNFTKPSLVFRRPPETQDGPVVHLDGSRLKRPFDPPRYVLVVCLVGAVAAAVIGGTLASKGIDQILHSDERNAATVESNISRGVSYDLPDMASLISLDDATILQTFTDAGFTTYDFVQEGETGIDVMKLPSDVTLADAAVAYAGGIGSMNAVNASKYLVGSWRFTCDRGDYTDMRVRYADLQAASADEAIANAMESEGWVDGETVAVTDKGVDEVGNTYTEGTVTTDSGTFTWRISACDLDEVYSIAGLPETAQYVGIRMTA